MAKYIECEAVIKKLKDRIINPQTAFINNVLIGLLEKAPAANVFEKRDCEQCKFFSKTPNEYPCSHCKNCYIDQFKAKDSERSGNND